MTQIVPNIEAVVDPQTIDNIENLLSGMSKDFKFVLPGALDDVSKSTRAELKRQLAKKINLKSSHILKAMKITKGVSLRNPSRTITIRGFRSNLKHYKGTSKQLKKGVAYRLDPSTARRTIAGAFKITGHTQSVVQVKAASGTPVGSVFVREKEGGRRVGRLGIINLKGPSVPGAYQKHESTIAKPVLGRVSKDLAARVHGRIKRINERLAAKAAKKGK